MPNLVIAEWLVVRPTAWQNRGKLGGQLMAEEHSMLFTRRDAVRRLVSALAGLTLLPKAGEAAQSRPNLKFEVYRDSRDAFRWRLKAANGRIMATSSEGYTAKANCRSAIETIQRGAASAAVDDLT